MATGTAKDIDEIINREIEKFENSMIQQLQSLQRRIKDKTSKQLVSARIGAKTTGLTESAIRQAASRGTIKKYNGDGTRKVTNSKTAVFYDLHEINNKMNTKRVAI